MQAKIHQEVAEIIVKVGCQRHYELERQLLRREASIHFETPRVHHIRR
jgi:hypothetical protein